MVEFVRLAEEDVGPLAPRPSVDDVVSSKPKRLTFEEASEGLSKLGKDETGARYAYLKLDAVGMKLTDVTVVLNFKHVMFLDLSRNLLDLEALQVVTKMPFLLLLKAERNRLESAALSEAHYLQVLDLNWNRISDTSDISQPTLEWLNLEFNEIVDVRFDSEKVPKLKELDLKGNRITRVGGTYPESIARLFLSENQIGRLDDLATCRLGNLTALHLRGNSIRKLDGFTESLKNLTYLNLRDNLVGKLREFRKLSRVPKLDTLIVSGNPLGGPRVLKSEDDEEVLQESSSGESEEVRIGLLVLLPRLVRINKDRVTLEESHEALVVREEKLPRIMKESSSEEEEEEVLESTTSTGEYFSEAEENDLDEKEFADPRVVRGEGDE
ncbi:leucine-rich repeat-containing protein 23-like [Cylas formicarius]|uniref:leucine-rich repeat-containing protein 23-like n=1 Tax=Cylas formicarius TaxID=197179 RepID=UPI002958951F|nr:leucine-rich repeat-containing protein 23-like [Cylas formicarius]